MSPAASEPPLSEEVTTTISRLSAYKNVHGVLILSRSGGLIRAEGPAFVDGDDDADEEEEGDGGGVVGEAKEVREGTGVREGQGSKYARVVAGIVDAVRSGLEEINDSGELKLLRIRTKKHELIITPDDKYLLVVLQDPS